MPDIRFQRVLIPGPGKNRGTDFSHHIRTFVIDESQVSAKLRRRGGGVVHLYEPWLEGVEVYRWQWGPSGGGAEDVMPVRRDWRSDVHVRTTISGNGKLPRLGGSALLGEQVEEADVLVEVLGTSHGGAEPRPPASGEHVGQVRDIPTTPAHCDSYGVRA